jgi:hypothetical protein
MAAIQESKQRKARPKSSSSAVPKPKSCSHYMEGYESQSFDKLESLRGQVEFGRSFTGRDTDLPPREVTLWFLRRYRSAIRTRSSCLTRTAVCELVCELARRPVIRAPLIEGLRRRPMATGRAF